MFTEIMQMLVRAKQTYIEIKYICNVPKTECLC